MAVTYRASCLCLLAVRSGSDRSAASTALHELVKHLGPYLCPFALWFAGQLNEYLSLCSSSRPTVTVEWDRGREAVTMGRLYATLSRSVACIQNMGEKEAVLEHIVRCPLDCMRNFMVVLSDPARSSWPIGKLAAAVDGVYYRVAGLRGIVLGLGRERQLRISSAQFKEWSQVLLAVMRVAGAEIVTQQGSLLPPYTEEFLVCLLAECALTEGAIVEYALGEGVLDIAISVLTELVGALPYPALVELATVLGKSSASAVAPPPSHFSLISSPSAPSPLRDCLCLVRWAPCDADPPMSASLSILIFNCLRSATTLTERAMSNMIKLTSTSTKILALSFRLIRQAVKSVPLLLAASDPTADHCADERNTVTVLDRAMSLMSLVLQGAVALSSDVSVVRSVSVALSEICALPQPILLTLADSILGRTRSVLGPVFLHFFFDKQDVFPLNLCCNIVDCFVDKLACILENKIDYRQFLLRQFSDISADITGYLPPERRLLRVPLSALETANNRIVSKGKIVNNTSLCIENDVNGVAQLILSSNDLMHIAAMSLTAHLAPVQLHGHEKRLNGRTKAVLAACVRLAQRPHELTAKAVENLCWPY